MGAGSVYVIRLLLALIAFDMRCIMKRIAGIVNFD